MATNSCAVLQELGLCPSSTHSFQGCPAPCPSSPQETGGACWGNTPTSQNPQLAFCWRELVPPLCKGPPSLSCSAVLGLDRRWPPSLTSRAAEGLLRHRRTCGLLPFPSRSTACLNLYCCPQMHPPCPCVGGPGHGPLPSKATLSFHPSGGRISAAVSSLLSFLI